MTDNYTVRQTRCAACSRPIRPYEPVVEVARSVMFGSHAGDVSQIVRTHAAVVCGFDCLESWATVAASAAAGAQS